MEEKKRQKKWLVEAGIVVVGVLLILIAFYVGGFGGESKKGKGTETVGHLDSLLTKERKEGWKNVVLAGQDETTETVDPENIVGPGVGAGTGAAVNVSEIVKAKGEKDTVTFGIDVSKYQGTIDWKKVANDGIDFAMIRVGYRSMDTGKISADSNARYNMQEATKYGIKIGAYFFSTAVSKAEAVEEAKWTADYISKYPITYPVAYNCEGFGSSGSRQYEMTKTERTDAALAFLKQIKAEGYTPMFYAAKGEMAGDAKWETSRIDSTYKVWVAQYPSVPYPQTKSSSYSGNHQMWQYTNQGSVSGISKKVDVNVAYFGFDKVTNAKDQNTPDQVDPDVEALMKFTEVNEKVTAKDKTNLRDKPSQGSDSQVKYTLSNGEVAVRTGVSSSGWSRLELNGKTYYAVSSYLTTDLSYKKPEEEPDDGIETVFRAVNDKVTPKDAVNLRTLPSVTNEASKVVAKVSSGEVLIRTGINDELGWSRVEYNGQILYCVSSYLKEAE